MPKVSEKKLQEIFSQVKVGHANAIKPPRGTAKAFKEYVDAINAKGDVVISTKDGYFRPFPKDDTDSVAFADYITAESAKAMDVLEKCNVMTKYYDRIRATLELLFIENINEELKNERKKN